MKNITYTEVFYSLQGEGRWVGVPSVFFRTYGCNFKCAGFGMPKGEFSNEANEIAKTVHLYNKYEELPLVSTGCDSYASWHPKFKKFTVSEDTATIAARMHDLIPDNVWSKDVVGDDIHLVITGGEPLLGWQRAYPELIEECRKSGLRNLTFETNGSKPLDEPLADYLYNEFTRNGRDYDRLTFSVSAKLPCSGEKWEDAIRPDTVKGYELIGHTYLKFVVATQADLEDADRAVSEYRKAGFGGPVYLMPVGGVADVYNLNTQEVADLAMKRGYRYSPRLQVDIWRNAWGT